MAITNSYDLIIGTPLKLQKSSLLNREMVIADYVMDFPDVTTFAIGVEQTEGAN